MADAPAEHAELLVGANPVGINLMKPHIAEKLAEGFDVVLVVEVGSFSQVGLTGFPPGAGSLEKRKLR